MHLFNTFVKFVNDIPVRFIRPTSGLYRREIDGLRFFAITLVLIGHLCERSQRFATSTVAASDHFSALFYYIFQRPGTGVILFFVISGFVIFSQVGGRSVDAILSTGFLSAYFKRRILRIEPPYFLLLLLAYVFIEGTGFAPTDAHTFFKEPASLSTSLTASLLYSHGWLFGTFPRLLGQGWSLEIEVQFYLVAPVLIAAYLSLRRAILRAFWGTLVLIGGVIFSPLISPATHAPYWELTLLVFFPYFWLGILLCDFEPHLHAIAQVLPLRLAQSLGWIGLLGLLLLGRFPGHSALMRMPEEAAAVACLFFIFLGLFCPNSAFLTFCSSKWVSFLGGACYSIYLTHMYVMHLESAVLTHVLPAAVTQSPLTFLFASLVLTLPLTLLMALLFYIGVERMFMSRNWPAKLGFALLRATSIWRPRAAAMASGREE